MDEVLSEEEAQVHEKALSDLANREYKRILKAIASGHTPDIIDRILLRMARKGRVGTPSKKRKRARR